MTLSVRRIVFLLIITSFMLCVPAMAEDEEAIVSDSSTVVLDYPDYWIAHVEAPEGEADLNTICVCIMLGSGAVCGILAGSEMVKRWNI